MSNDENAFIVDDDDPLADEDVPGDQEEDGMTVRWASKAYKTLHARLRQKEQRLERREQQIDDCRDRITIMGEHLRNVQFEIVKTQELLDAKVMILKKNHTVHDFNRQKRSRAKIT
jgi:hypothetical protein